MIENLDGEIWKDVIGFEGIYQVSNMGNVRSVCFHGTDKIQNMGLNKTKFGYLRVQLSKNGKIKHCSVHRLVAEAFLPNPMNLPQVNHKNEQKDDNQVTNLEWCTAKYNVNFGTARQRMKQALSNPIEQFTLDGVFVRRWNSIQEAWRGGFNGGSICQCLKGRYKTSGGFIWKHA